MPYNQRDIITLNKVSARLRNKNVHNRSVKEKLSTGTKIFSLTDTPPIFCPGAGPVFDENKKQLDLLVVLEQLHWVTGMKKSST